MGSVPSRGGQCLDFDVPKKLWNIWDIMKHFKVEGLLNCVQELQKWERIAGYWVEKGKGEDGVPERFTEVAHDLYRDCQACCVELSLTQSVKRLKRHTFDLLFACGIPTWTKIANEFEVLRSAIVSEVEDRRFIHIEHARQSIYDEIRSANGESARICAVFRRACKDYETSAFCLALDLNTASVFHSMRVAEYGLRALAKKVGVRLTDRGVIQPYEYAEWDKVLTGIKSEITNARALTKGPKRSAQLELLSDAAEHCVFMKDIWRNSVSHTREPYIFEEAHSAFLRVRGFMDFLVRHLKNGKWI
jgi:hypothetical protein